MTPETIGSAFEQWTLHSLAVAPMLAGFAAFALVLGGAGYRERVRNRLSLRLSSEVLHALWDVLADALLFGSVLLSFVLLNPDVMSEVALPLPLLPLASLALLLGLGLRAFYRGRLPGTRAWWIAVAAIGAACALNWVGLTYVMNGPNAEWLSGHPSAAWSFLFHLRSNENPALAARTLLWTQPALLAACAWLVISALRQVRRATAGEEAAAAAPARPESRAHFEVQVDPRQCTGCAICLDVCPQQALTTPDGDTSPCLVNGHCDGCGVCTEQCPTGAITVVTRAPG